MLVATDHPEIAAAAKQYGYEAVMTRATTLPAPTDRRKSSLQRGHAGDHIVVNVQGDEPLIAPATDPRDGAEPRSITPMRPSRPRVIRSGMRADMANPNVVKVVLDHHGYALYFSRAPVPYARDAYAGGITTVPAGLPAYRHLGIYAYRGGFLQTLFRACRHRPSSNSKRWNNCARCGMATASASP